MWTDLGFFHMNLVPDTNIYVMDRNGAFLHMIVVPDTNIYLAVSVSE